MARRVKKHETATQYPPRHSPPMTIPAEPLVLDDIEADEDDDEDFEDEEEDMMRRRLHATRTLFHQPRGDNDTLNSTQSLYDSDVGYITIHGRRYCGTYFAPNDEEEQTREQMLHRIYLHLLSNKLTTVPLQNPEKILDIGTGTGEWAMAIADEYPEAEVIGTDIAKIQPAAVPPNVFFEIDDAEEEGGWTWPADEFDLIHFRSMAGAFTDWKHMYRETFVHLKPGGWIEVIDFNHKTTVDAYFGPVSPVAEFTNAVNNALKEAGRPRTAEHLDPDVLRSVGFTEVSVVDKYIPVGVWPEDKNEREVGKHYLVAQLCGIAALGIRPLTERGWDIEEVMKICSDVTEDIKAICTDPARCQGMYSTVRFLTGRKPGGVVNGDAESVRTVVQEQVNGHRSQDEVDRA